MIVKYLVVCLYQGSKKIESALVLLMMSKTFSIVIPLHVSRFFHTAVDGGYGEWTEWTTCDVTCGEGKQSRERACNHPLPAHGGKDCQHLGPSTEVKSCLLRYCSE